MNKKGIAVAGNMIVDILYPINGMPKPGELTTITADASRSSGGALCNDILDLALLDPELPLVALGRVGNDPEGDFVMDKLRAHKNIDLQHVITEGSTSMTLVMADEITKQRTFYHSRGGNAKFCEADIPWDKLDVDMLHIGYILLLDALDEEDSEYGTKMARLLHSAQQHGIKTSIDVVSEAGDRFRRLVCPAMKYTDYCIINEMEAGKLVGLEPTKENLVQIAQKLKAYGVRERVIIHTPELGICASENDVQIVPSYELCENFIQGTTGAGDAFCAGALYGIYQEKSDKEILEFASAVAVASLSQVDAVSGLRTEKEIKELCKNLKRKEL